MEIIKSTNYNDCFVNWLYKIWEMWEFFWNQTKRLRQLGKPSKPNWCHRQHLSAERSPWKYNQNQIEIESHVKKIFIISLLGHSNVKRRTVGYFSCSRFLCLCLLLEINFKNIEHISKRPQIWTPGITSEWPSQLMKIFPKNTYQIRLTRITWLNWSQSQKEYYFSVVLGLHTLSHTICYFSHANE